MTQYEASHLLRKISSSGRLPDDADVRVAEVCVEVFPSADAKSALAMIKERRALSKVLAEAKYPQGGGPFVCPKCKRHDHLRKNPEVLDEFCDGCQMFWQSGYFIGWNVGWRERASVMTTKQLDEYQAWLLAEAARATEEANATNRIGTPAHGRADAFAAAADHLWGIRAGASPSPVGAIGAGDLGEATPPPEKTAGAPTWIAGDPA